MNKLSGINMNNIKKYNLGSKGFTLVELLAVIALLAIISVIAVYSAVNVIGSAKQKSYEVSVSNIEKQAGIYALENQNEFVWLDIDGDLTKTKQYFCVSVQDLIDSGYFKNDVLDSYIKEGVTVQSSDNIYLERDTNTKTITQNVLLSSVSGYDGLCNNDSPIGNISFSVKPSGWTREKEVIITYKLINNSSNIENYKYSYNFLNKIGEKLTEKENKFSNKTMVENVIIKENGTLNALLDINPAVNSVLEITTIDNIGPKIEIDVTNGNSYSKSKEATIKLVDNESGFKVGSYNIYYQWSMDEVSCEQLKNSGQSATLLVENDNNKETSSLVVTLEEHTGNGKLYVCGEGITDYVGNEIVNDVISEIVYLDNEKPVVTLGSYIGELIVSDNVTIPLIITDEHSGVDSSTFTESDVKVSIGGTELTNGITLNKLDDNNYNLVISNNTLNGDVLVVVNQDGIYDKAGNGNLEKTLDPGIIFKNKYKISYDANGGTGSMLDTECTYENNCTVRTNTFTRTGYTFLGWSKSSTETNATYIDNYVFSPYNEANNITLYAVWKINKIYIKYNTNGGTVTSQTTYTDGTINNWKTIDDIVYKNDNENFSKISYGGTGNPVNYNYAPYLNITKTGYKAVSGSEWKCMSNNCNKDTYNQLTDYNASDFCDASSEDCTITLGVNWIPKTYTVTSRYYYYYQNTTWTIFSTKTDTVSYGDIFTPYNVSAPSGYHARNSYNYYDADGNVLGAGTVGNGRFQVNSNMQVNVYYDPDQYTVSYDANGGSGGPTSQTKIHGLTLTLSDVEPTRTGYTFLGWSVSSTATSKTYDVAGSYTSDTSTTLYAVWELSTKCYKINVSQGRNCRNKPSLSGSSVVIGIPKGWYVKVDDTVNAEGYSWYHSVKYDCYFISDNALEYTPEDGVCPETSSSSSGNSSSGNSSTNVCGSLYLHYNNGITYCCTEQNVTNFNTGTAQCYMLN